MMFIVVKSGQYLREYSEFSSIWENAQVRARVFYDQAEALIAAEKLEASVVTSRCLN